MVSTHHPTSVVAKPLSELLSEVPGLLSWPPPEVSVTGISTDSRHVQPGNIFVARAGDTFDGHVFIPDAVMSGAAVVIGEQSAADINTPVPYLRVRDGREAQAWLSAAWHGFPARRLAMIGITGTDGKTTTANLLFQILRAAGLKVGMISTVNAVIGDQVHDTGLHVTTPDASQVQQYLAQMVAAGSSHAILEATSHGLAQHRVTACDFDVAVVTNITHEHLNYHGDWEAYFTAKARLILGLATATRKPGLPKVAVLNADDATFERLMEISPERVVSYGLGHGSVVTAHDIVHMPDATRFVLAAKQANSAGHPLGNPVSTSLTTPLIGVYNVYNILAAAAAARELGVNSDAIREGVAAVKGIPGRMERLSDQKHPFLAIVDFAHTPNALREALRTARRMVSGDGRVIAVWGSAGLRDREKRRLMAQISAELADITVLTAEDPRTEPLEEIMAESATALEMEGRREGKDFWQVEDRGQALRFAVELARPGDVVIACGKGHEQSMCFGTTEYPWDEREALRRALLGETLDTLPTAKRNS